MGADVRCITVNLCRHLSISGNTWYGVTNLTIAPCLILLSVTWVSTAEKKKRGYKLYVMTEWQKCFKITKVRIVAAIVCNRKSIEFFCMKIHLFLYPRHDILFGTSWFQHLNRLQRSSVTPFIVNKLLSYHLSVWGSEVGEGGYHYKNDSLQSTTKFICHLHAVIGTYKKHM